MLAAGAGREISTGDGVEPKVTVGIIGAGWYGVHTALTLQAAGYTVTLMDKNSAPFSEISGKFGVRLHTGQHYPRSEETRASCRVGYDKFRQHYPEMVNEHEYSIYALGIVDANGKPPKVDEESFRSVCHESETCEEVNIGQDPYHYQHLACAMNIPEEPSLVLGVRLREYFMGKLVESGVRQEYDFTVTELSNEAGDGFVVVGTRPDAESMGIVTAMFYFNHLINATSFKAHVPRSMPFGMEVVYQVCLALIYRDLQPSERPISFIVMDGWFPCVMPYDVRTQTSQPNDKYLLTHAKYTNPATFDNFPEAKRFMDEAVPSLIHKIKTKSEEEAVRHWPEFSGRFEYVSYAGEVLVKAKTEREFRSAVTFSENGLIHVVPGKVSNIFEVADEVQALIEESTDVVAIDGDFKYVINGVLAKARAEVTEARSGDRNTCDLNTHRELSRDTAPDVAASGQLQQVPVEEPELDGLEENKRREYGLTAGLCSKMGLHGARERLPRSASAPIISVS